MRQLKRLFLLVLGLTFVGGLGTGAWVGSLVAAQPVRETPLDRRVDDFERHFDLDATQIRQLRTILAEHDHRKARIQQEVSAEQFMKTRALEQESRDKIRVILTEEQRGEYDKLVGRK
ncbi:MAG: hypothetical protein ACYTEZ_06135 [Planctomycetota bacterium]|jgi:hypothetical protein